MIASGVGAPAIGAEEYRRLVPAPAAFFGSGRRTRSSGRSSGVGEQLQAATDLEPVRPGDELPGGLQAHYDGRGQMETPIYLPEQRALVFADGMTAPGGVLRVWGTPWHQNAPSQRCGRCWRCRSSSVLVAHGEPVHARADFVAALDCEPRTS
jgi:hypothetical protein